MLRGFIILFIFQFIGESLAKLFSLVVPGPVIGMILLLIFLILRKKSFKSLDNTALVLLKYLPLMFIPSAIGIITQVEVFKNEFLAIFLALILGTSLALVFSALLMDYLSSKYGKNDEL